MKGMIQIPSMHGTWLLELMKSPEYQEFIDKFHEESPNQLFHHKNLSEQIRILLFEQLENKKKETKS